MGDDAGAGAGADADEADQIVLHPLPGGGAERLLAGRCHPPPAHPGPVSTLTDSGIPTTCGRMPIAIPGDRSAGTHDRVRRGDLVGGDLVMVAVGEQVCRFMDVAESR